MTMLTTKRRRGTSAAMAALCSGLMAATAVAAPTTPLAIARPAVLVDGAAERVKGSITLIPLEDQERALVAIAATFNLNKYCDATSVIVSARVNGVAIEPPFPAFIDRSGTEDGTKQCSATGVFRLDLDAAELIHPGAFLGQPLNVTLTYWG